MGHDLIHTTKGLAEAPEFAWCYRCGGSEDVLKDGAELFFHERDY